MEKIEKLLKNCNFITTPDIQLNSISESDVDEFCYKYDLTWFYSSRVGILFRKKGELVTDFKNILV